jgi:hypothetical protein
VKLLIVALVTEEGEPKRWRENDEEDSEREREEISKKKKTK